jgi:superfamily II DNA or RNA helicase
MITIRKKNEATLIVESKDSGILMEVNEYFTFFVEGYKYMPLFKNRVWDGKCRLYNSKTSTLPYGLLFHLAEFAKSRGYELKLDADVAPQNVPSMESLLSYLNSLTITCGKDIIKPRDYQIDAITHALRESRSLLISPTGSGKSLIIYCILRWFLDHSPNDKEKVLIVVPSTSLVEQLFKDFGDYSQQDADFDNEIEVHRIYSGKEKINFESRVVVTTWQSAITLPRSWFLQFGMVIGDEAHLFKAKSLNTIMAALVNARFRIGTTGTIDNTQVHELVLTGNFGPVHRVTTTQALIESDTLAALKIQCLVLDYSDELKKIISKLDYKEEIDYIVLCEPRNKFITNLTVDQKGNTLVLYNLVQKHGKPLYDMIKAKVKGDRKVFFVSGSTDVNERERIREITEKEKDAIIVASVGTFSTGINIKNLHQIIFAAPTKSQIRVLQSIGRGLRKSDDGRGTIVYDISDNFSWKKTKNYTMQHAIDRVKIYAKEGFDYKLYEIKMSC